MPKYALKSAFLKRGIAGTGVRASSTSYRKIVASLEARESVLASPRLDEMSFILVLEVNQQVSLAV
jgi:hypothetical protein